MQQRGSDRRLRRNRPTSSAAAPQSRCWSASGRLGAAAPGPRAPTAPIASPTRAEGSSGEAQRPPLCRRSLRRIDGRTRPQRARDGGAADFRPGVRLGTGLDLGRRILRHHQWQGRPATGLPGGIGAMPATRSGACCGPFGPYHPPSPYHVAAAGGRCLDPGGLRACCRRPDDAGYAVAGLCFPDRQSPADVHPNICFSSLMHCPA